jgi:hypothetical protein
MPRAMFEKLIFAKQAAIKLGGTKFELSTDDQEMLRLLAPKANQ